MRTLREKHRIVLVLLFIIGFLLFEFLPVGLVISLRSRDAYIPIAIAVRLGIAALISLVLAALHTRIGSQWIPENLTGALWLSRGIFVFPVLACLLVLVAALVTPDAAAEMGNTSASMVYVTFWVQLALLCAVGIFEEALFRLVLMGIWIPVQGARPSHVYRALIISSLIFGAVHLVGADIATPLAAVQALAKLFSASAIGFILGGVYLKTRSLGTAALIHIGYDLLSILPYIILTGSMYLPTSYVAESANDQLVALAMLGAQVLILLPGVVRTWRLVPRLNYETISVLDPRFTEKPYELTDVS